MDHDRPSTFDVAVVILSPLIVAAMTVCFLLGWWGKALWGWVMGEDDG